MERIRLKETPLVSVKKWLEKKDDSYLLARHILLVSENIYRRVRPYAKKMNEQEINKALADLYRDWYIEKYKPDVIM